jgi:hypothetical protein
MLKFIGTFLALTFCVYATYNWLVAVRVPQAAQVIGYLGVYGAAGAAAAMMMCSLLFARR